MWDEPQRLNKLSKGLVLLSVLLLLAGGVRYVLSLPVFPVQRVIFNQVPVQVTPAEIEQTVLASVRGNFFMVDIEQTRNAFEQLPWVRKASVRRKFPWSLEIDLEEHQALARWNTDGLVNTYGEVFLEQRLTAPPASAQALPLFVGQPESSADIAALYAELQTILRPIKQNIGQINLSPRFAWQIRLNNGMSLELGREQMQQRLSRFVAVYPYSLAAWESTVKHVDLRYRNGFAAYMPGGVPARRSEDKV